MVIQSSHPIVADAKVLSSTPAQRMTVIDALRGIAALLVVHPHFVGFFTHPGERGWMARLMIDFAEFGHVGYDVFFVLSGFVIAYVLDRTVLTPGSAVSFWLRRALRLDPPYWISIFLMVLFLGLRSAVSLESVSFPTWPQLVAHVFYLQQLLGFENINVVYWTLCLEVQFYIVAVLLLGLVGVCAGRQSEAGRRTALFVFLATWMVSLAVYLELIPGIPLPGTFLPYWHEFSLGTIAYWVVARRCHPAWLAFLLAAGGAMLIAASSPRMHVLAAWTTSLIILLFAVRGRLYTGLTRPALQYLGKISYSLYLVHVPVGLSLLALRARVFPTSDTVSFVFFGTAVACSVGFAHLFWRFVEQPAVRLSHAWTRTRAASRQQCPDARPSAGLLAGRV
jgi:peptidoglycan/LPS O-acetylase OafA/YrhL